MAEPDLSKWDLWTIIAVLSESRHHKYWDTREQDVRERLLAGADPNAGRSAPLTLAASMGHLPICRTLLEFGADVHGGCRYHTPLVQAADHPEIWALLLENGAEETIFTAIAAGDNRKVEALVASDRALVDVADEVGLTPLFLASARRNLELMALFLREGADPNATADGRQAVTPIHEASVGGARADGRAAIELLVRHVADLDARDKGGVTALHMAVRDRDTDAVRALLALGATVDIEDRGRKSTPLRRAVANTGRPGTAGKHDAAVEIVSVLLAHGADPRHVNRSGRTLLESTRDPRIKGLLEAAISGR